jgi:hypothetical protein
MMWFFLEALAPLGLVDTEAWTGGGPERARR